MKENDLVTVIIPIYNIIEYLPRCVESVKNQTYRNLEIILVDDGSTDGTGELCDSLALSDPRIMVLHKKNGGSSSARNMALEIANGQVIGFVDSDDYIEPTMYELLVRAMIETNCKIVQIGRKEIAENGEELPLICIPPKKMEIIETENFLKELLMHTGDCSFCTKLFDSTLFEEKRFPLGVLNEDFKLLIEMLEMVQGIVSLSEQAYYVYYREGSNTRKTDREEFSRVYGDGVDNADQIMILVSEKYCQLLPIALRFNVFQRLEYLLHIPISQMLKSNSQYIEIVNYLRKNSVRLLQNDQLTLKNKIYSILFAIAPKLLRVVHRKMKGKAI